jgi:pimeloyl-ACP methyl ester carboxylesterase
MSTPHTLDVPEQVEVLDLRTARGTFAAHRVLPPQPRAHVLLVPGWTGSKEDFTPLLVPLAGAGYAVTTFDQRGQFETPGTADDDYSLSALAQDAAAVATTSGFATSHLLGHSFGGLVAQQAVVDAAGCWSTLSLLCTGPGALGESPERPLGRMVEALGTVPLEQLHAAREQGARRPRDIAEFLLRRFTGNSPDALRAMTQHLIDAPDLVDEVAAAGVPCWVGRGADDDAWPHERQSQMARRLGTEAHVVESSAHSPAIENTTGLLQAWLPFLETHT